MKTLYTLLFFVFSISIFAQDKAVVYPGCDSKDNSKIERCFNESVMEFIEKNISYPKEAIDAKKEGTVYIKFVIDTKGNITQVENALSGNGLG
ncbi:MAG TPA: energy transducer TonB, partial [Bacteroidia bacterium]